MIFQYQNLSVNREQKLFEKKNFARNKALKRLLKNVYIYIMD